MAISIESLNRKAKPKPPRMLVYGVEGVGKTTLAAGAPNPVFLWIEDGRGRLDVPGWPEEGTLTTFEQIIEALGILYTEEHDRQTVCIDSVDWLERLVHQEACRRNGWASIEQPGYGKGYKEADAIWLEVLNGLNALRDERGMGVILIAHAQIKRFENPETDAYDRYKIKLQERAEGLLKEYADAIAFLNYRVSVTKEDPKNQHSRKRAVGGSQRVVYLAERPAFVAKNRDGLPDSIDLPTTPEAWGNPQAVWSAVAQHFPYYNGAN